MTFAGLTIRIIDTKIAGRIGNAAISERSDLVYCICSDFPDPVFTDILQRVRTNLNMSLLTRPSLYLNVYFSIFTQTTGYSDMNKIKRHI